MKPGDVAMYGVGAVILGDESRTDLAQLCAYCVQHGTFRRDQRMVAWRLGALAIGSNRFERLMLETAPGRIPAEVVA